MVRDFGFTALIGLEKSCLVVGSITNQDYNGPSLFSKESPGVPGAYFGGPWLPMSYADDFTQYSFGIDYPLQILEQDERRKKLVSGLVSLLPSGFQPNLFLNPNEEINKLFDEFLRIKEGGKQLYSHWEQKVGGKVRSLVKPKDSLDFFLRNYVLPVIMQAPCHPCAHGGEKGWSVKRSLETHLPLGSVLSFDLARAFENVDHQYVFDFYYSLFDRKLDDDTRRDLAGFLTHVSSVSRGRDIPCLPQGSPISIALFNRLLYPIDELLYRKARKRNLRYSRWVDDMIISAAEDNRRLDRVAGAMRIVRKDFPIKMEKVFWQQGVPEYYLLGHKIIGNLIVSVNKDEARNRGNPIDKGVFFTDLEWENGIEFDNWIEEDDIVQCSLDAS